MDSPADNLAFKDKFNFPYDLLSDTDKSMSIAYGAAEADSPRPARISVLVGPDGKSQPYIRKYPRPIIRTRYWQS